MSLTREPLTRADGRRAGELLLAYLADGDDSATEDQDRYNELMAHTLAEFHPVVIIDAMVALWAGSIRWMESVEHATICRAAIQSYVAEPVDEWENPL